jgi:heptosyltransferase III
MEQEGRSIVSEEMLQKTNKILFVAHLAIGDFTYLQNCFAAFKRAYPHISIDLWIDETRRTWRFWRWPKLKRYALIDWISTAGLFRKVYSGSYSWFRFKELLGEAQKEEYPLVVSLGVLRYQRYARYARQMSPKGFVVGLHNPEKRHKCNELDGKIRLPKCINQVHGHTSNAYRYWFESAFGLNISDEDQHPFVNIPRKWVLYAKLKFMQWGIPQKGRRIDKVVFINAYAKDKKRSWSIENVIQLILKLRKQPRYAFVEFIINTVPGQYEEAKDVLYHYSLNRVRLMPETRNLYQLPAVMSLCDLIISVETSVMHLAAALKIPVVALMRTKNPEWIPYPKSAHTIVWAPKRRSWICDISVESVFRETLKFASF